MEAWNDAALQEAAMMAAARVGASTALPDFGVQLEIRIATIGMYATVYLLEDAYGVEFSREFHADPEVRRVKRLANKIVGLGNDVFSLGKDMFEQQINLVTTLMHEKSIGGDEALEAVVAMHDAALVEYDRLAESILARGIADAALVERWLTDVRHASLGFSVWESKAPRYTAHKIVAHGAVIAPGFSFI